MKKLLLIVLLIFNACESDAQKFDSAFHFDFYKGDTIPKKKDTLISMINRVISGGITTPVVKWINRNPNIVCLVWHADGLCSWNDTDTLPSKWVDATKVISDKELGTALIGDAGIIEDEIEMLQPKFIQVRNPRTKKYLKIDTEKGKIVSSSKRRYKNIPLAE